MFRRFLTIVLAAIIAVSCSTGTDGPGVPSFDAASIEDLDGCNVAIQLGSIYDLGYSGSGMNLMRLANTAEIFTALQSGVADYALISDTHIVGVDIDSLGFKINFSGFTHTEVGVGFRYEDKDLCDRFNTFLSELKDAGIYDEMVERWSSPSAPYTHVPEMELPTEGDPLTIGILNVNYPFTFMIGPELSGFEIEMMNRFSVWSGRPLVYTDLEFSSAIVGLVTKKIDIIVELMSINEERAKKVLFSNPYFEAHGICLSRLDTDPEQEEQIGFASGIKRAFQNNLIVEDRWKLLLDGFIVTLEISLLAILFGTLLSFIICGILMSDNRHIKRFFAVVFRLISGIPVVVILMILFYVVFSSASISGVTVGIIAFSILFGISAGNLMATNIRSIGKGQTEAARALGSGKYMTFFQIILPQAIKKSVPVFKSDVGNLIKNTAIVGYIAVQDITKVGDVIRSRTFDAFFPLIVITLLYFFIVWLFKKCVDLLFARFK